MAGKLRWSSRRPLPAPGPRLRLPPTTRAHTVTYLDPSGSQLGHKESGSEAQLDRQLGALSTRDHPGDCGNKTRTSGGAGGEPEP
jgi:hypothetical protein